MRVGKQILKRYDAVTIESLYNRITEEWERVYNDCKIVDISIVNGGMWYAYVVYEEVE